MHQNERMSVRVFVITSLVLLLLAFSEAGAKEFVLVIDPGHGGKDIGASRGGIKEKDINLSVALALGAMIGKNHPDVKVIYTRKKDVFVELDSRARIANKAKADLFISVHVNAVSKGTSIRGAETFVLGLSRSEENLEVAKRENSVILLEDNYEQKYEGFDPNSVESYIIFELMQNKFMEQSITLASYIQKEFLRSAKRTDRGVKQAGFLVLRQVSMPSVLVELGFISNPSERSYMTSKDGQSKLCASIYNAFTKYKSEHDRRTGIASGQASADTAKPGTATPASQRANTNDNVIYKVQLFVSPKKLPAGSSQLKGYKDADFYREKGMYKYTYGATGSLDEIKDIQKKVSKDFKDAFIVAFKDGKRIK